MCPAAGSADAQTATWLASYAPPITARLNAGAPGANLTDADTFSLISLCPFESVAKGHTSPFCTLFGDTDVWAGFAYSGDLDKYYGTGCVLFVLSGCCRSLLTNNDLTGTASPLGACRASGTSTSC